MDDSDDESVCFYRRVGSHVKAVEMNHYELINGPDQVIPSTNITTTEIDGHIKIKFGDDELSQTKPESIPGLLARAAAQRPNHPALAYKKHDKEKGFHYITYREYVNTVRTVAKAFLKLGLKRYHSVAILGTNCPEWVISHLAAIHAGGIATGIYTTNSAEACYYCVTNSRANIVVVEDEVAAEKILKYKEKLPEVKKIIQLRGTRVIDEDDRILSWNEVMNVGRLETDFALEYALRRIAINQCCILIYTSGTTGNPKPAMLSHDNVIFNAKMGVSVVDIKKYEALVSYLPLSHVAAQIFDIIIPIVAMGTVYFANKDALKGGLLNTLLEVRPTRLLAVPRVWEKIAEKMKAIGAQSGYIKRTIAGWAKSKGLKRYMDLMNGIDNPSIGYYIARALIFSTIKRKLGLDRCKTFLTGAAPLTVDIKHYFASIDIPIMDAFGMTECSGVHTMNTSAAFRLESIGRSGPGVKTKILNPDLNDQGEICMHGRNVFMGYFNDRIKTDEAIDKEGWLHSGDLGKIDENGFVYITGRIKELLITAGGENIPPNLIEENIKLQLPFLGAAVVIGDKKKFLTVLLTLSSEVDPKTGEPLQELSELTRQWLKSIGCPFKTIREVLESGPDNKILKALQMGIDAANEKAISNAQKVQKFALLPSDFSIATGEYGPTLKLRRSIINSKYKDVIDKMYANL